MKMLCPMGRADMPLLQAKAAATYMTVSIMVWGLHGTCNAHCTGLQQWWAHLHVAYCPLAQVNLGLFHVTKAATALTRPVK